MRLIYLHGAPAVGKLTVANEILKIVPGRLFDNHAAIDVARTVFDFGAPGFWELVNTTRISVLESAAKHDVALIVMTACYSEPEDRELFLKYFNILKKYNGEILPVYLQCSETEMLRRVNHPDRLERRKISSSAGLRTFLRTYNLVPVPHEKCLQINTGNCPADKTAQGIAKHFQLV